MGDFLENLLGRLFSADEKAGALVRHCLTKRTCDLRGLVGSLLPLFLLAIRRNKDSLILLIINRLEAEMMAEELCLLDPQTPVFFLPEKRFESLRASYLNPRETGQELTALDGLLREKAGLFLTTPGGVLQPLPDPESLRRSELLLEPGQIFDLPTLVNRLVHYGFSREAVVERPGEMAVRGGILDLYPYTGEGPLRLEFEGDAILSIREIDPATQRSIRPASGIRILPVPSEWAKEGEATLLDYLEDPVIVLDGPETFFTEEEGGPEKRAHFFKLLQDRHVIAHRRLWHEPPIWDFGGKPVQKTGPTFKEIHALLETLISEREHIYLLTDAPSQKERLIETLGLLDGPLSRVTVEALPIRQGFDLPDRGLTVYTERELFHRPIRVRRRIPFREGVPIRELSELRYGDYMVHVDYGIGRYVGLRKITVNGAERECLCLEYQDEDLVYVPVDKMERVQKYAGRDGVVPTLTKLGSPRWEAVKARTKKALKRIARDLIALYAARETLPGHAFQPDTPWEKELMATFPFEDTPDQAKATEEVKRDMERPRPMDRLLCGDVGYGKTEVAIRAAFKAVVGGKQVAVLVPTTVLAQQHLHTFRDRLGRFPVQVEMLSRFKTPSEQREIIERLKKGTLDIVIGTHRLLSPDVAFKDLGLLIIDEEHRFGVRHKEKMKAMKKTVDVLVLSATPIPRTLQLSLLQIRDMSLITTPPRDRHPIHTEVLPFDEAVVAEAIRRELARGGQVFFVHNRVQSIHAVTALVKRLVPEVRLCVAHGQMNPHVLEKVMIDFVEGRYDCMVATMIVESGLDIPQVNTLLVNRADRLGLAQLYQLRGRVGRSDIHAYAFLFTPPFELLSPDAVKRLRTIEEFTELGSGFQIALRDLEIRGAGNLLGTQQSGFIDEIGFDLYTRFVREAVEEVKSEMMGERLDDKRPLPECLVDLSAPALIPETYVSDEALRVNLYRRMAGFQEVAEVDDFESELRDRFGPLPQEVVNLLEVTRLRLMGRRQGLKRIILDGPEIRLFFDESWPDTFPTPEQFSSRLRFILASTTRPVRFIQKKGLGLMVRIGGEDPIPVVKNLLQSWEAGP